MINDDWVRNLGEIGWLIGELIGVVGLISD